MIKHGPVSRLPSIGIGIVLKAVLFGGAATICFEPRGPHFIATLGMALLCILNLGLGMTCRSSKSTESDCMRFARRISLLEFGAVSFIDWGMRDSHSPTWLLAIPLLIAEMFTGASAIGALAFAGAISAIEWLTTKSPGMTTGLIPAASVFGTATACAIVSSYKNRLETIGIRSSRIETLLNSTTSLAKTEGAGTAQEIIQLAVCNLGATAGFVALVSDENPSLLVTEAAFGTNGEFIVPVQIKVGTGLSGCVALSGRPMTVYASKRDRVDCDGIADDAAAAVSVPLLKRGSDIPGSVSEDQTIGVMTLAFGEKSSTLKHDDLELVQNVASALAGVIVNQRIESRQRSTFLRTLEHFATALDSRSDYTRGFSQQVTEASLMIGRKLGLSDEALEEIRIGATLHDIGKIGIPDSILNKPDRLTDEEFEIVRRHPVIGYEICKPLALSEGVLMIIRNHHEKLDGTGYPDGLRGGELPLPLRIVSVANAFAAMNTLRPYRKMMTLDHVVGELRKEAGTHFDPVVVETLHELLDNGELGTHFQKVWNVAEEAA